jgi:uncharacterized protein YuzE
VAETRSGVRSEDRDLRVAYDAAADVLYVVLIEDRPAVAREISPGVLVRVDPDTNEVVGFTLTGVRERASSREIEVGPVHGSLLMDPQLAPIF